jgi:hypothetical protein
MQSISTIGLDIVFSHLAAMPNRLLACRSEYVAFGKKADIKWQAGSAGSVENDPTATATA